MAALAQELAQGEQVMAVSSTYGGMQSRIGDEIQDSSLTSQVQNAIQDAIAIYESKRFYFNQVIGSFWTVPNQEYYGASDFPDIPLLIEIDSMILAIPGWKTRMRADDFAEVDAAQRGVFYGWPRSYSYYNQQIRMFPIPNGTYQILMSYHRRLPPLVAPGDTNAWMQDGEMLIRQTAKGFLAVDVLQEANVAQGAQMMADVALNRLQMETRKRRSNGLLKTDLPPSVYFDIGGGGIVSTGPAGMGITSRDIYFPGGPIQLLNTDNYVFVHNGGGPLFLTPPVAPVANQTIWIKDSSGTAGTAPIGLTGTVDGVVNPVLIDVAYGDATLVFSPSGIIQRQTA